MEWRRLLALPARAAELPALFSLPPRPRRRRRRPFATSPKSVRAASPPLFFYHGHGARTAHPPSSPPSPPASLAFISPVPSLSPARPPSPASMHDHHGKIRADCRSSCPLRDLLLSLSPARFQSPSPVPSPGVPPCPAPRPRSARSACTTGRTTRSSDALFIPRALPALHGAHPHEAAAPTQLLTSVQYMATPPSPSTRPRRGRNMSVMSTR
jgi:hypothetical protein